MYSVLLQSVISPGFESLPCRNGRTQVNCQTIEFHAGAYTNSSKALQNSYSINGTLSFHGVTNPIENVSVEVTPLKNALQIKGSFVITPNDFGIKIPSIVSSKIAERVTVVFDFELLKN